MFDCIEKQQDCVKKYCGFPIKRVAYEFSFQSVQIHKIQYELHQAIFVSSLPRVATSN